MSPPAGWTHAPDRVGSFRRAPSGAVYRRRKGDQSPVPVRGMCAVGFSGLSVGRGTVGPGARGGATGRNRARRPRIGPSGKGKVRRCARRARTGLPASTGAGSGPRDRTGRDGSATSRSAGIGPEPAPGESGGNRATWASRPQGECVAGPCRVATTSRSRTAARTSPPVKPSSSPSCGRSRPTPTWLCSTRRPAPWTPWPSTRSGRPSCGSTRPAR